MKHYLLTFLLLWSNFLLAADPIRFSASVSSNPVAAGEQFEVSFSVNANIEKFGAPNFNGFQVLSGPNQSSSMTSINGNTSVSMSLSYILVAERPGDYTIGPAVIEVAGKQYRSNPVKVKVVKGAAPGRQPKAGSGRPANPASGAVTDISKRLFIRAVPNKTNVYQGEQLAVTYKLYTNIELVDNGLDKLPDFNGFWSQEIKNKNPNVEWSTEVLNGTRYNVAVLKQIILFPERSGKLSLDPLGLTFLVRVPVASNDPFEMMFGGSYEDKKYKIKSQPITINVKPLPESGKPVGFQGAVGNFSIAASLDKSTLKANEAINYALKISGSGNLKLLKAPVLDLAADIEKYDPKVNDQITESMSGVSGSREYSYLLIPRHEGKYKIEPYQFSYFNPATQRYVTLSTKDFELQVAKGLAGDNVTAFSGGQQDVKSLATDIRYIKTDEVELSRSVEEFDQSPLYYVLLGSGPVLFLFALGYRKWYREQHRDQVGLKSKRAGKMANKHLAEARKQLELGNQKAFYEAVYKGIYGYLSDKLNIDAANLNQEHIVAQLQARNVDESLIRQLTESLELCEMARYAPVSGLSQQQVFDKVKNTINEIETNA
ncbi:BatD family protein [Pedobacter sp. GR22-6]|uniref:BatD family protein n=1 Tax=Pedobacter sp. GR22-6 TaxID=3127957 RepID=UPI00307F1C01